jgi:PKD repeat protein
MDNGDRSEYYVGVSDYGHDMWRWYGPFADSHVRLSLPQGDYLSALGNLFLCVLFHDGATADVVGVAANSRDGADAEAPPAPGGLTATPVVDGLDLAWSGSLAGDLAGYRIYYAPFHFVDRQSTGVRSVGYIEGTTRHLLAGLTEQTYVRIAAVDVSGNESDPSNIASATPLAGTPLQLQVVASLPSGLLNDEITLSASGAEEYAWDLDGNGTFEVTGDTSGIQSVDTTGTGLIRPAVRGESGNGESVACGGVSVIVAGNSRPVASAVANPQSGNPPLEVTFTGTAEDAEDQEGDLTFAWDFDGDGFYEGGTDTLTPDAQTYTDPGLFNAKFRVTDTGGAWDVDTVAVQAFGTGGGPNDPPSAVFTATPGSFDVPATVRFDATGSSDEDGTIVRYDWDFDGDGIYEIYDAASVLDWTYTEPNYYNVSLRVTDSGGAQDTAGLQIAARGWVTTTVVRTCDADDYISLIIADGHPAIAYSDDVNYDVMFVRANDALGADWGAASLVHDGLSSGTYGDYVSAAEVDGRPAICFRLYGGSDWDLRYVRADDAAGDSWGTSVILDTNKAGMYSSLAVVSGKPAVCYYDYTNKDLKYVRSNDSTGSTWGAPVTVASTDDVGRYCHMLVVNGNPAISYYYSTPNNDLMFVRASDSTGSSWNSPAVVLGSGSYNYNFLTVVDGRPAICAESSDLVYIRSDDANGNSWSSPEVFVDIDPDSCCMAVFNNRPVMAFMDDEVGHLGLLTANDPQGASWGELEIVDPDQWCGYYLSMVDLGSNLAIAYTRKVYDSEGDFLTLKYAYYVN